MDLFGFIGSAATGLISIEKVSNNPDEDGMFQEDIPEDLRPPHKIVRAPRASKISTDILPIKGYLDVILDHFHG